MSSSEKTDGDSTSAPADRKKSAQAAPAAVGGGAPVDGTKPTVSHMLGEIVWLLSQSPLHRHFAVADLEWLVMPPLLLEQYRVFRGEQTPVGVALWAYLSQEAEDKLNSGASRLRPDEWKSGDRLWLIELISPFATAENKLTETMLAELMQTALQGRRFKMHRTDAKTGEKTVLTMGM